METNTQTPDTAALDIRPELPPVFVIDTEPKAEWALSLRADIEAEKEKERAKLDRVKAQVEQRIAELDADARAWEHRFGSELQAWAEAEKGRRRRQTVTLAYGSLCFTSHKAALKITDEAAAENHARAALPGLITTQTTTRETFDKTGYVKAAQGNGELLPGMELVPAHDTFAVKFPDSGKEKAKKGKSEAAAPNTEQGA